MTSPKAASVKAGSAIADDAASSASSVSAPQLAKDGSSASESSTAELNRGLSIARPDDHLRIVCHKLSYSLALKRRSWFFNKKKASKAVEKVILHEVSAIFRPGRLTAVMGASGAGKTSLLNLVAGDISSKGRVLGQVRVNGERFVGSRMTSISGFVFQDDVILDTMTVAEAVTMSALLRLPKSISSKEKAARGAKVIEILELEKCANTRVGSSTDKGISGGERKRTAMAMEMVTNPPILFLDEPTSGLDTFTAYNVVDILSTLAAQGRTVIATIHQPSSEVFHLFDDLLLLAEGRVVYYGEVAKAVDYFARNGFPCPQFTNPADYIFMEILKSSPTTLENSIEDESLDIVQGGSKDQVQKMLDTWEASEECASLLLEIEEPAKALGVPSTALRQHASFITQFRYLLVRASTNFVRNKMLIRVQLIQTLVVALLVGLLYLRVGNNALQAQIQNRNGALYFLSVNMFMASAMSVLSVFALEKAVFMREWGAGYYSLSAYYCSKIIVELPYRVFFAVLLTAICYYMIGLQPAFTHFATASVILATTCLCGTSFGITVASICSALPIALAVLPIILLPLMMFGGLFANSSSTPVYLGWIKWISPIKYSFTALAENEFTGLTFSNCDPAVTDCSGEMALAALGFDGDFSVWMNILMLAIMYVVITIMGYLGLLRATLLKNKVACK